MSDCDRMREAQAFHDGEGSAEERRGFEAHAGQCEACAAELRALRGLSGLLGGAPVPDVSPETLRRVHEAAGAMGDRALVSVAERLTAVAAVVLVACTLWLSSKPGGAAHLGAAPAPWEVTAVTLRVRTSAADTQPLAQWMATDLALENGHD